MNDPAAGPNRFLRGDFTAVREEVTAFDLPVTGTIPAELNGRYLRNGPNPIAVDDARYHLFLGDGMVHGVRLRDGRAEWYRNRWVRQSAVNRMLGEPPRKATVYGGVEVAANTHVIGHAGRTLALVEGGTLPYELGHDLSTLSTCDFEGTLPGGFTAHPKLERATGELHAVAYMSGLPYVTYHVVGPEGRVTRSENISVPSGAMMHDFALTQNHVLVYDLPVTFNGEAALRGALIPYEWNDAHQARIGVMPRAGTAADVRWVDVDPVWIFHTLNAYDDGERVVLDVVTHPRMMSNATGSIEGHGTPALDRYTLDPAAGKATVQRLDDRPQEFPRINDRLISLPYRYGYTAATTDLMESFAGTLELEQLPDDAFSNRLIKHDLHRGTQEIRTFGRAATLAEPVFVPAAAGGAEDDGYLLVFVHDPERSATDLVILAAQDVTAAPVATVHLPARVPLGFHGSWLPDFG
ncbi:carotenoid oxygenase family protein [Streptomyces sp. S.PB5]|uniref:carotenoid oxygenase family protein n=1 Tax=Streptomyces sp. S.PB5 TaxID=3020844 RepID=UPI0025B12D6E|nr:carotenoid oxygenase family protein [Streptomyces sp. S.PB5]MDN3028926.1 carotenoid oxygenase family protein [Streptomyces sp. S.PB5]